MSNWPRIRYHAEKCLEGRIVRSEAENKSLGRGWVESQSECLLPVEVPAPALPVAIIPEEPIALSFWARIKLWWKGNK
jgi:hypothetical protein